MKRTYTFVIATFAALFVLSIVGLVLLRTFYAEIDCTLDPTTHVPHEMRERFLKEAIQRAIRKDYIGLKSISRDSADNDLSKLADKLSPNYEIIRGDSLGGFYTYTLKFENGTILDFALISTIAWAQEPCPHLEITDEKILGGLQLATVRDVSK